MASWGGRTTVGPGTLGGHDSRGRHGDLQMISRYARGGTHRRLVAEAAATGLAGGSGLCWASTCLVASFRPDDLAYPYWSGIPSLRTDTCGVAAFIVTAVSLAVSNYLRIRRRQGNGGRAGAAGPGEPGPRLGGRAAWGWSSGPAAPPRRRPRARTSRAPPARPRRRPLPVWLATLCVQLLRDRPLALESAPIVIYIRATRTDNSYFVINKS